MATPRSRETGAGGATIGVVLGDQLDARYPERLGLDRGRDTLLMMEVAGASTDPPSHVQRTVLFLAAMRHHAEALRADGWTVEYRALNDRRNTGTFEGELGRAIADLGASGVACVEPGSYGVRDELARACEGAGVPLRVEPDPHFLCPVADFECWAEGRKELILEFFYRDQRRRLGVLMTEDGKPEGGAWNFDKENRKSFRSAPDPPRALGFDPDAITRDVVRDVRAALPDLPGRLEGFDWPVTRAQALEALADFVEYRLARFGDYQERPLGRAAHAVPLAHRPGAQPQAARPARGRRRGGGGLRVRRGAAQRRRGASSARSSAGASSSAACTGRRARGYADRNGLDHHGALPEFYWTGETDMACVRDALAGVLDHAYGHHIERLMITGNFALIAGVEPGAVNDWYRGMYADAVDWVTTPNTIGMALHADGGVVGTKPYAASGKYVQRMSNHCKGCRYDVSKRTGEDACPFNTLYWDFLLRHRERFSANRRMTMILKNLDRFGDEERVEITVGAERIRERMGVGPVGGAG